MDLKSLFQVNAVVALLYGIVLLVIPTQFLAMYAPAGGVVETTAGDALVAQLFGVSLIAVGLICWLSREAEASVARHAIVTSLFWTDAIGAAVSAFGTATGAVGATGWTSVGVYVLLAGGYAYFLYVKVEARQPAA